MTRDDADVTAECEPGVDDPPAYLVGLHLAGRRVVIVGGGRVTARRLPILLAAGADVHVICPAAHGHVEAAAAAGELTWHTREYRPGDLSGAWYAMAATDIPAVNERVVAEAEADRIFCVRADDGALGQAVTPATARRGAVQVGVLSGGDFRVSRRLRDELAAHLPGAHVGTPGDSLGDGLGAVLGADPTAGRGPVRNAAPATPSVARGGGDAGENGTVSDAPIFDPPCGPVIGWYDDDVVRATGIPYARADRFTEPVAAPHHVEPLHATSWSPKCPQAVVPFLERVLGSWTREESDEHCQRLSITMPADRDPGEALPVMVWIHGGSYVSGAGDLPIGDPRALVAEQRVIVVTVTYRLGLFGYLGQETGRPANLGLLDQLEALRWVQRNIAAFGGDPARVTAFGQSAGGDAVAHLMAVPGAAELFGRAIIQSAPLGIRAGRAAMNAAMSEAAHDIDAQESAEQIVARQEAVLAAAAGHGLRTAMPFGTQYGHDPLPAEEDIESAWNAAAPHIAVLIGYTSEEAALFVPRYERVQRAASLPMVGPVVRKGLVGAVTQAAYGRAGRHFAQRHAAAGGTAYRYLLSWGPGRSAGNPWGAAHTVDLPLLFPDRDAWADAELLAGVDWDELDRTGRAMRAIWGAFARGEDLGERGGVPGALTYRRVR